MLTITQVHYIRKLFFDKGKTFAEIEKATGHNYRTIRKYIEKKDFNESPKKVKPVNKSDYLRPYIRACLNGDNDLKLKHRLYKAESIYRYLKDDEDIEITISKRRFRTLVAEEKRNLKTKDEVYIDLKHPGGEAQLDFGEVYVRENGNLVKKHELVISFPYSNAGYVQITESEQSEALFEAMSAIFNHIGKVPKKIWFDQMSTAALRKKDSEGNPQMSKRLMRFSTHYGFESVFCNPYSGHEKGSVENKVGYFRRNLINIRRDIKDLDEMNRWLLTACDNDQDRAHYQKRESIKVLFQQEKEMMRGLNKIPIDMSRMESRKVDKYGHITFEGNRYSVHPSQVQATVHVQVMAKTLNILNSDYKVIAKHQRDYHKDRTHTHWKDFIDPLRQRPRAVKYSGIYQLLPDIWQTYLDRLSKADMKESLSFLKHCLVHQDLNTAEAVLKTNMLNGNTSPQALWTTLYRLSEDKAIYESVNRTLKTPSMPTYKTNLDHYDTFIQGARNER